MQQVHYWLKTKENDQQDYIDGHYWVYNTYKQWQKQFPFWHLNTIQRTFISLEKNGLLISANYNNADFDKTKWYTINYPALNNLTPSHQNGMLDIPKWAHGTHQNEQTNTIDYTKITTERVEGLKGISSKQNAKTPFNPSIMDSVIDSFLSCSDNLDGLEYDPDAYYAMIDRHFKTQYQDCDYNICHFMSEEARNNRFYETCF